MMEKEKQKLREKIWNLMEEKGTVKFPLPCHGRIPNFEGSEKAAEKILELEEWKKARVIKVNPDSPQRKVRELVLKENKVLVMPTPRLKEGFLVLKNLKGYEYEASSIEGAFKFGKKVGIEKIPSIDLIVCGSVAVTLEGIRLGKGGGYGDLEYGISREIGKVKKDVPIVTTVHEVQIVDYLPRGKHDVPVDYIITPSRIIKTNTKLEKPKGIYWELVTKSMLKEIPLLNEIKARI